MTTCFFVPNLNLLDFKNEQSYFIINCVHFFSFRCHRSWCSINQARCTMVKVGCSIVIRSLGSKSLRWMSNFPSPILLLSNGIGDVVCFLCPFFAGSSNISIGMFGCVWVAASISVLKTLSKISTFARQFRFSDVWLREKWSMQIWPTNQVANYSNDYFQTCVLFVFY